MWWWGTQGTTLGWGTSLSIETSLLDVEQGEPFPQVRDCMVKMYRQEGLRSFWKGIVPPVLVETPKRGWKFFTFEQFQKVFRFGSDKPTALVANSHHLSHPPDLRPTRWPVSALESRKPSLSTPSRWSR